MSASDAVDGAHAAAIKSAIEWLREASHIEESRPWAEAGTIGLDVAKSVAEAASDGGKDTLGIRTGR